MDHWDWPEASNQPAWSLRTPTRGGDGDGPGAGEKTVFTGSLRRNAADLAYVGWRSSQCSRNIRLFLLVGHQDIIAKRGQTAVSTAKAEWQLTEGRAAHPYSFCRLDFMSIATHRVAHIRDWSNFLPKKGAAFIRKGAPGKGSARGAQD